MAFIEDMKNRARKEIKTIVLPEATDERVLKGGMQAINEGYAKVVFIGNREEIEKVANENNIDIKKADIVDPAKTEKLEEYAKDLYELRKEKGLSEEDAHKLVLDTVYFGMMMVKRGEADGLVSGAVHSTADTLRPALQILKTAPGTKLVSAFFIFSNENTGIFIAI